MLRVIPLKNWLPNYYIGTIEIRNTQNAIKNLHEFDLNIVKLHLSSRPIIID